MHPAWLLCFALVSAPACYRGVAWSNHVSLRAYGAGHHLSHVDPEESYVGRITKELHYVTLSFDALSFRNVPGARGRDVAFGVEVRGAGMKPVRAVWGGATPAGRQGRFTSASVPALSIGPFLHDGSDLQLGLWLKAIPRGQANLVASAAARRIAPADDSLVELTTRLFDTVMASGPAAAPAWRYHFTLGGASAGPTKADGALVAARHILLFSPPVSSARVAPAAAGKLIKYLGLRGQGLVWSHDDRELTELPYLILRVGRHLRLPQGGVTGLRSARQDLGRALAARALDQAQLLLAKERLLIDEDPRLSAQEREFWRRWAKLHEISLQTLQAARDGNKAREMEGRLEELFAIRELLRIFAELIEAAEMNDLLRNIESTVASYEALAKIVGKSLEPLSAAIDKVRSAIKDAKRRIGLQELGRQKLAMKYDTGKRSRSPPPKELLDALEH